MNGNRHTRTANTSHRSRREVKWNFAMGVLHGIFFSGGQAFVNPDTILPVFLNHFTQSKAVIGLASSIMGSLGGIGNVLPQLMVAHRLENRVHKRSVLRVAITIRGLSWGALALITYFFAETHPGFTLGALFVFLLLFTVMGGVAVIPFYDIWGKALPTTLRGKFFAYRQLGGGLLAIGTGFLAKTILGNREIHFPDNFALLFFLAFLFMSIGFLALGSIKEPPGEVHKERLPFLHFLKKALKVVKTDANYRMFLYVRILAGASALSFPFYVLYARDILKVNLEMVGIFLLAQMSGNVLSNLAWGPISDKMGNRTVLQGSTLLGALIPLLALITPANFPHLFVLLFFTEGVFLSGNRIGKTNYLLDIAPPKDRPTYISINGTFALPVMLFPLMGGFVLQHFSYSLLFGATLLLVLTGFIFSTRLKCVRKNKSSILKK